MILGDSLGIAKDTSFFATWAALYPRLGLCESVPFVGSLRMKCAEQHSQPKNVLLDPLAQ